MEPVLMARRGVGGRSVTGGYVELLVGIIIFVLAVYVAASLLPGALTSWLSYTPSNATVAAIYIVTLIIISIAIALIFLAPAIHAIRG